MKHLIICTMIFVAFTHTIQAQSVSAGANIVAPISLTEITALHFGSMIPGLSGGTCVLSTSGVRTQTGTVMLVNIGTAAQTATYSVGGRENATYAITLPANITVSYLTNNMIVDNLKAAASSTGSEGLMGTLSTSGTDFFAIGGTLNVNADQMVGTYTGSFTVTVAYN